MTEAGVPRATSGMTLVEVLLALGLTLLVLAGACRLACLSTRASVSGDRLTWAAHLCNVKLAEIEAAHGAQPGWHGDVANPLVCNGHSFARYWNVSPRADGQMVEVFVVFSEPGRPAAFAASGPADLAASPRQSLRAFIAVQ